MVALVGPSRSKHKSSLGDPRFPRTPKVEFLANMNSESKITKHMKTQIMIERQAKTTVETELHVMDLWDTEHKMNCVQNGKEIKEEWNKRGIQKYKQEMYMS